MDKTQRGKHLRRCSVMVGLLLGLCLVSCQVKSDREKMQLTALFDGFQLILIDDIPPHVQRQDINPAVLRNTYPEERSFIPNRVYAFRKLMNVPDESLAMEILPKRFRDIGATVKRIPQSSGDFIHVYVGGPLFLIEFEKDEHPGTIFNRVYIAEGDVGYWEELIVVWE